MVVSEAHRAPRAPRVSLRMPYATPRAPVVMHCLTLVKYKTGARAAHASYCPIQLMERHGLICIRPVAFDSCVSPDKALQDRKQAPASSIVTSESSECISEFNRHEIVVRYPSTRLGGRWARSLFLPHAA